MSGMQAANGAAVGDADRQCCAAGDKGTGQQGSAGGIRGRVAGVVGKAGEVASQVVGAAAGALGFGRSRGGAGAGGGGGGGGGWESTVPANCRFAANSSSVTVDMYIPGECDRG